MQITTIDIAKVCHETNKAFCESLGDLSQKHWDEAEQWQRDSAVKGVEFKLNNPNATPSDQHDSWVIEKISTGWKYGPVKNAEIKEHPCIVPYSELPLEQRIKDHLFVAVVNQMKQLQ